MKCNIKDSIKRQISQEVTDTLNEQLLLRDLLDIVILHEEFGFGQKRLEAWGAARDKLYEKFTIESRCTDNPYRRNAEKMTNLKTAVLGILRDLKGDRIDYHTILGVEELLIDGKGVDAIVDMLRVR